VVELMSATNYSENAISAISSGRYESAILFLTLFKSTAIKLGELQLQYRELEGSYKKLVARLSKLFMELEQPPADKAKPNTIKWLVELRAVAQVVETNLARLRYRLQSEEAKQ
jgi:hypothetical protein